MLLMRSGIRRISRAFSTRRTPTELPSNPAEYYQGRLEGTVPQHDCYIFLHSYDPPTSFPSVHKTSVSLELQRRAVNWRGLVNFSWFKDAESKATSDQPATVFSRIGGALEIPDVSLENMDEVEQLIQRHLTENSKDIHTDDFGVHIYVCTHGARDCRCGERGKTVYDALVEAVERQRVLDSRGLAHKIKVGEVSHVGGHKLNLSFYALNSVPKTYFRYAANVLIYPQGEWLGIVEPKNAPSIIAQVVDDLAKGVRPLDNSSPPTFLSHWRGRMGLSKEEQKQLWAKATGQGSVQMDNQELNLKPVSRA